MKKQKQERGQLTLEAVLLITFFVSLSIFMTRELRNQGFVRQVVEGPWAMTQGMIENGVWMAGDSGKSFHPNNFGRKQTIMWEDMVDQ